MVKIGLLMVFIGVHQGCTRNTDVEYSPQKPVQPTGKTENEFSPQEENLPAEEGPTEQESAAVPVSIKKELFEQYNLDLDNLSFKFSYLDAQVEDEIKFVNGRAKLLFEDLKKGESGTLTLEIFEGDQLKLRGEKKDLVLETGINNLELSLQPVEAGETTDLIIDLSLPDGSESEEDQDLQQQGDPDEGDKEEDEEDKAKKALQVYNDDIAPILDASCVACHTVTAPNLSAFPFPGEDSAKGVVEEIINSVSGPTPRMPMGGAPLSEEEISKLKAWSELL